MLAPAEWLWRELPAPPGRAPNRPRLFSEAVGMRTLATVLMARARAASSPVIAAIRREEGVNNVRHVVEPSPTTAADPSAAPIIRMRSREQ